MDTHVFAHIRRRMVQGLLLVLPFLITLWLLRILFDLVNLNVTPWVVALFNAVGSPDLDRWQARIGLPIIGILLTAFIVYLLGLIAGNLAGKRLVRMVERFILRVPLVKGIYGSARQLLDAFTVGGRRTFSRVVVLEYPRKGLWTVGFVTREVSHRISRPGGNVSCPSVPVFLPTTPNPTSGWLILVPRDDLQVLRMSIEDGLKLIVSGGIVSPDDLGELLEPWSYEGHHSSGER